MREPSDPPVSIRALAGAYGLPPDLDVAGHPGAGRSAWHLLSPSTGDAWHLRSARSNGRVGFQAGRELTRIAIQAGLGLARPLAMTDGALTEPSFDPATVVLRRWLEGCSLERDITPQEPELGEWLGDLLAGLHQVWPLVRLDDDELAAWYGVFPQSQWEQWFNEAEDLDLPWTALAPSALPVLAEATSLVSAGLAIRGKVPVTTHRLVEPRHIIAGPDEFTLIDPFSAGLDLAWLEVVDVALLFPASGSTVLDAYVRRGGATGPSIVEAACRRYGREMQGLGSDMQESLASPEDEETIGIAFASIQDRIDRFTDMVERIDQRASIAFG